jgi:cell wall-associated NlpC family hydrolase
VTDSNLAAIQARVGQLAAMLAVQPIDQIRTVATDGTGGATSAGTGFAGALALALQQAGATSGVDGAADSAQLGQQAVQIAKNYLGVPYRWGGTDPSSGLDCSGLTQLVFKQVGVQLPRTSAAQAKAGTPVASLSAAQPGDLVFFGSPVDHVGIYVGDGKMLEAPHTGARVRIRAIHGKPVEIRRVTGGGSGADAASGGGLASIFAAAGARNGVDPDLLAAVAHAESGFDTDARSPAGALGLMQLMPSTARSLGVDPMDPTQAADGAARLLAGYLRDYGGRTDLALAAYNAGPGAVQRYGGVPPYNETRTYIQRVTGYLEAHR